MGKNGASIYTWNDANSNGEQNRDKRTFSTVPPRDRDFLVQLAVPSKWRDIQLGLKGLQVRGATVQNLFSRFRACAMRNSFFLGSGGPFDTFGILSLPLAQCCVNVDVFEGDWLYFCILATLTVGESLLKKRRIPCIFVPFQRRHLQM